MQENNLNLQLRPELKERKLSVKVELVTPQFGGGAESRKPDAKQWLRPASVRGALRFWWRALFGASFSTPKEMHAAESSIFGCTAAEKERGSAGKVSVTVRVLADATVKPWDDYQQLDTVRVQQGQRAGQKVVASAQSVAYFPANENKREQQKTAGLVSPSAQAVLTISDLSFARPTKDRLDAVQWEQVLESLRAFILFGGSGSRTRRAAGAICLSSAEDSQKLSFPTTTESIKRWVAKYTNRGNEHECFLLSRCQYVYITQDRYDTGEKAQEALLAMWREFRQQRPHPASWFGGNKWGRTNWPEADAIRMLTKQHASWENKGRPIDHAPLSVNEGLVPRAHLGLPIIVKFKDDDSARKREEEQGSFRRGRWLSTDPPMSEIVLRKLGQDGKPVLVERYASPVLLAVTAINEPSQPAKRLFVGLVLITRSILQRDQTVVLKAKPSQPLSPGNWIDVLSKQQGRRGLLQTLDQMSFQPILTVEGTMK